MKKIFLTLLLASIIFYFSNAQQKFSPIHVLKLVSMEYNKRAELWGKPADKIDIDKLALNNYPETKEDEKLSFSDSALIDPIKPKTNVRLKNDKQANDKTKLLDEVIVLGYETVNKPASVSTTSSADKGQLRDVTTNSTTEGLVGRLAGVNIVNSDGAPGAEATIDIRGRNSITQDNGPLVIIDGIRVEGGLNSIAPQDIDNITVLKDAGSAAIYGASGANGVIIVTTKNGKSNEIYGEKLPLKDQDDISYIQAMKQTPTQNKYAEFATLQASNSNNVTFYMDMALYFNEIGMNEYVDEMLNKATTCTNAMSIPMQCNIAFTYDYMKRYDKAISIYKKLCNENPDELSLTRDLGWAYFENKQYDSAVNILYNGIIKPITPLNSKNIKLKDIMLADMNMIIALHKNNVDVSTIPSEIIKPISAELRVIVESPYPYTTLAYLTVKQPWKHDLDITKNISKSNARLQFADQYYSICEFQVNQVSKKSFAFKTELSGKHYNGIPNFIRVIKIKNFGKTDQTIDTDFISLDNQSGETEFIDFTVNN